VSNIPFKTMGKMIKGLATPEDVAGKEVVIFHGLGFVDPTLASKINQYIFFLKPSLVQRLLIVAFYKKKMPSWIKKPKKAEEDDIDRYCREHALERTPVLEKLVEQNYREFLTEIRADEPAFTKAGLSLTKPAKNKWFG